MNLYIADRRLCLVWDFSQKGDSHLLIVWACPADLPGARVDYPAHVGSGSSFLETLPSKPPSLVGNF